MIDRYESWRVERVRQYARKAEGKVNKKISEGVKL